MPVRSSPWITASLLSLTGLPLLIGGIWLVAVGGSFYYLFAGTALIAAGALLVRGRAEGVWLYGIYIVVTIIWSLWENGFELWRLMPRILVPLVLGLFVIRAARPAPTATASLPIAVLVLAILGVGAMSRAPHHATTENTRPTIGGTSALEAEWRHYGRTAAGTRFSPADQIHSGNVHELDVAWTYRMGDPQHRFGEHQVTPLQVGSYIYLCTDRNDVIALDAESGKELWRFNSQTAPNTYQRCRGVGYHEAKESAMTAHRSCHRRIVTSTIDVRLIALDAETGKLCPDFGQLGIVDLKTGMGEVKHDYYYQTSAPLVAGDLIVIGGLVRDSIDQGMPSGVIRAFNAITGTLVWAWDPGNPKILGLPPEGDSYSRGSPNMWSSASYDDQLGLIYVPLGVATGATDSWGGWRSKDMDDYSNSIVALEVATGRPRWHFQTVHHDLWDYDLPMQPTLFDIRMDDGSTVPALIQGTKRGQIFVLDRRNGVPIAPVEEKSVPHDGQTDDWISPTQPYSIGMPAIGAKRLTEADMWGLTPFDQLWCRIEFRRLRYEGDFTPPTTTTAALIYPGMLGGLNWGGVTIDEKRGYLIVNDIRMPLTLKLIPRAEYNQLMETRSRGASAGQWPFPLLPASAPYGQSFGLLMSPLGIPCNAPPWGTLTAVDLHSKKIAWQIPLGTTRDTRLMGLELGLPLRLGLPTLGGSIVTGSGLVFFAGTRDYYLRAIDVNTGTEIWKGRLPVGAQATPMTYISPRSGRQFVLIVAGGVSFSNDKGDYVIAFALKNQKDKS